MEIKTIDHLVITARDINATARFYESVLGMTVVVFGEGRTALKFGNQKINLHQFGREFEPKAAFPTPGSQDLCFITEMQLEEAMEQVRKQGVVIIEGPVARTGALGPMVSFYFRDPDGNLIEVAHYE